MDTSFCPFGVSIRGVRLYILKDVAWRDKRKTMMYKLHSGVMLYFLSLFLSSALSLCVTIIRNLLILRISFKQKQTQSIMQAMNYQGFLSKTTSINISSLILRRPRSFAVPFASNIYTNIEGVKGYLREPWIACFIPRELWNRLSIPSKTWFW